MKRFMKSPLKKVAAMLMALIMVLSPLTDVGVLKAQAAEISIAEIDGYEEGAYVEWAPVEGADGYQVYVSKDQSSWTLVDDELIRSYGTYMRVDVLGLTAGDWYIKIEAATFDSNKQKVATVAENTQKVTVVAHDRSGYAWEGNGTASGAYNEDGSLRENANVIYVTNANKDTVSLNVTGANENPCVGIHNILTGYAKGKETKPLCVRFIGNVTDPATTDKGDLVVENKNKNSIGITLEGIGEDATCNGWGIRVKNASNVEIRNLGFMNCNSDEGDNVGLQQGNDHIWVHHCDMFYGDAGSDADQVKGDGALDTKKSTYVTHSYNHFWDSGKCNLQGANSDDTSNYITYHHNWYDHSDSRHPRVRVATVHVYNNYYDGNSKYGIGSTTDSDVFAENNYFRNCKYPMLTSNQGSDIYGDADGTFSGEAGGVIKAYNNYIEGAKRYVVYKEADDASTDWNDTTDYDVYEAATRDEKVPSSVVALSGGASYNNFDTASDFYEYKLTPTESVPSVVMAGAGRVNGGDFQWNFNDSVDDEADAVDDELKAACTNYTSSLVSVGGIQGASTKVYCTVTFDPNNGENTWEEEVEANTTVAEPATPTTIPDGKVSFDGWYNGSTKWSFTNKVTSNMTLTGKWLAEGEESGGGEGGEDSGGTGGTPIENEKVVWDITKNGLSSAYFTASGNFKSGTLTSGTYEGISYVGSPLKLESGTKTSIAFTTACEKAQMILFLDSDFSGKVKVDNTNYTATAGIAVVELAAGDHSIAKGDSANLFAVHVIPEGASAGPGTDPVTEYTITVDLADGSVPTTFTVSVGAVITSAQLSTPTRVGYSFTGWVDSNNNAIVLPYTPTGNMTIKATWQEDVSGDDTSGGDLDPDVLYNLRLNAESIPGGTYTEDFSKGGFTITAGEGDEQSVVVDPNNKTINGTKYTQRLKLGGAGTAEYRSIKFTAKEAATLQMGCMASNSKATFQLAVATLDESGAFVDVKEGYTVDGATVDSSNGSVSVDGASAHYVTVAIPEAGTYYIYGKDGGINFYFLNLIYANGVEAPTYTVTFNTLGGLSVDSQTVVAGEYCVKPAETLRAGYTFGGWYADYDCTREYDFSTPITGNITIYAKWIEGEAPYTSLVLDMKDLPARDYKEAFTKHDFKFAASSSKSLSVDASSAVVDGVTYTQRLKFGGSGSTTERSIGFTITKDSTVTLVAESGSAGTARSLAISNGTTTYDITNIDAATKYTQELAAGTWYVYSTNNGVNVYYIAVEATGGSGDGDVTGGDVTGGDVTGGDVTGGNPGGEGGSGGEAGSDVMPDRLYVKLANPGEEYIYTGSAIKPAIVVYNNGEELTAGVHYTVKYSNNTKASTAKKPAKITVTGKGNLTGKASTTFVIQPKPLSDEDVIAGDIVIAKNTVPVPVLVYNNKKLTSKDYTYLLGKQKYTETSLLVIQGKGNFTGSRILKVTVVEKKELKKFTVTVDTKTVLTYNGEEQIPTITVKDKKDKTKILELDKDYIIDFGTYSTVNAGTVKFNVIGIGEYTGTVAKSYKIKPIAVKEGISFDAESINADGYTFVSGGVKIDEDIVVKYGDTELVQGKDYKVAYSNNKKVSTTKSQAKFTISFLGNYKGSKALKGTFKINPAPLSNDTDGIKIVAADKVYTKKNVYKSAPFVTINGVTLKSSNYKVTYYTDAEMTKEMSKKNKIELGENETSATVYVKIVGKGNYAPVNGEYATAEYQVVKKATTSTVDLSKARVTFVDEAGKKITKVVYTGNELEPTVKVAVKQKVNGKNKWVVVDASNYEVSYVNNVNKGTATAVVTATGDGYVGSKTAKFKVAAKNLMTLPDLLRDLFGI